MAQTADGLLGLLSSGWQILIAVCMAIVTVFGLARIVHRGPTRMAKGVFVTGLLILAITVFGTLAVSCSGAGDGHSASGRP